MHARVITAVAIGVAALIATNCARPSGRSGGHARVLTDRVVALSTSRGDLDKAVSMLRTRLTHHPRDTASAVALADALLRQTRVTGNAGLSSEADRVVTAALVASPDDYAARRMLATIRLSQHRFREAIQEAARCRTVRTDDDVVDGVLGDAHVELGEYPEAFAAFDRMNARKPTAASYARASYARELQGDLPAASRFMQMAAEATAPQDIESLAWHHAQLGHLALEQRQIDLARREYEHAEFLFPGHPFAAEGRARVAAASGNPALALDIVNARLQSSSPMPSDFALAGDLLTVLGRSVDAERQYRLAEAAWRSDVPEPARLARFLAEHGRHPEEAWTLAEAAFAERKDIFTADALAWSAFRTGRMAEARAAIAQALRTGTRDRDIRAHAAAIAKVKG